MAHLWGNAAASLQQILTAPAGASLWYDARIPFMREDAGTWPPSRPRSGARSRADPEGFKPDSVIAAVRNNDWNLLKHSGLTSVQLVPPSSGQEPVPGFSPGTAPRPGAGPSQRKGSGAQMTREREHREGAGWYRIANSANGPAQILIYDEIGMWGVTASDFIRDLAAAGSGPVEVHINSGGGDVFDAYAIYNALLARTGVTTVVDSLAASAASVIAMAGEQRLMARTSQMMIHDASAWVGGNAEEMQQMVERLETVSGQLAGIYADTAGGEPDHWRGLMRAETWFTPERGPGRGLITGDPQQHPRAGPGRRGTRRPRNPCGRDRRTGRAGRPRPRVRPQPEGEERPCPRPGRADHRGPPQPHQRHRWADSRRSPPSTRRPRCRPTRRPSGTSWSPSAATTSPR
jgi:ATP-dependent protease ClpP protease subunit